MSRDRWAQVIQTLITVAAAVGLCWWALRDVTGPGLAAALAHVHWPLLVAVMTLYTVTFFAVDVTGFTLVYRRHVEPRVPVRDVAAIVCGKQLPGLLVPIFTKVFAPLYFRRQWAVGVLRTVGASELVTYAEMVVVLLSVTLAFFVGGLSLPLGVLIFVAVWWVWSAVYLTWVWLPAARGILPRLRDSEFFRAFGRTRPAELSTQIGLRAGLAVVSVVVVWSVLADMGHRLTFGQIAAFGALFLFVTQLPISVGGFGGPQGVSVLLLADTWHLVTPDEAVAFSLLWSTSALAGRAVVGAAFAVPMVRAVRRTPRRKESLEEQDTAATYA